MNSKRFAYQFFHFQSEQWNSYCEEKSLKKIFEESPFPSRALQQPVRNFQEALAYFEQVQEREAELGINTLEEIHYPSAIGAYLPKNIHPPFLFQRGAPLPEEKNVVAVVGTRHPSALGREAAKSFSRFLASSGIITLSGLAKGIDAIAHEENISRTVAVLGGGVHGVYPAENAALAEKILCHGGTLLSPFPLGQVPLPQNFPYRNKFIAALSAGIVVIEGAESSGAAITGKLALEMGKNVVTLTQDYRSAFGKGAIKLLEAGAIPIANEQEGLEAIYSRLGGRIFPGAEKWQIGKSFSVSDFVKWNEGGLPQALAKLEQGISLGRIEKIGVDRYRLRKEKNNARH